MRKITISWILVSVFLLLYSFTQVDLSLTLSRASFVQDIQKVFQYVGWFNRPLSTLLFITIIGVMLVLYGLTLSAVRKKLLDIKRIWKLIIMLAVILFFAYNAFSYDLFNYIFDAKILTHYGLNPYEHKALDFAGDPMLSFMHWTHRSYPYGPVWLAITVPLSFLGFGYFLVTFYLFKLIAVLSYIWSAYLIKKIAQTEKVDVDPTFAVAAFALNPLVIVETLVSAHNDMAMIALALFGVYAYFVRSYIKSFVGIMGSLLLKYATVLIIPAIFARGIFKVSINTFFYILIISMSAAVLFATYRTNFQPWYLLFVIPFAVFVANKYFVLIPLFVLTLAGLLQYIPYLYLGNWNPPIPMILNGIMLGGVVLSFLMVAFTYIKNQKSNIKNTN